MSVIFFLPLVLSLVGMVFMVIGDYHPIVKGTVTVLVAASLVMQFTPGLRESIHFLIPLGLQILVSIWWLIAQQLEGL